MRHVQAVWNRSPWYRGLLIAAAIYALVRLGVQIGYLVVLPRYTGSEYQVPVDLQIYLDAARRLATRQNLYPQGPDQIEVYQYAPSYALTFTPFLALPTLVVALLHTLLHVLAYAALYWRWQRLFDHLGLDHVAQKLAWALPIWLLFSSFWTDLGYLNIYVLIALLATLLIEAVLHERLGWSLLWLSIILQIKPHWAFAVAVPLLLGRRRFFLCLAGGAVLIYAAIAGVTVVSIGPVYGYEQYTDYVRFLGRMRDYFPWRGPGDGYLGYNHSLTQVIVYLLGPHTGAFRLATTVKVLLLAPLGLISAYHLLHPGRHTARELPYRALDLVLSFYLAAFIWLDMVWELSLGLVVYVYIMATENKRWIKIVLSAAFLVYALLDPLRLVSFGLSLTGLDIVDPGPYILTDPNIYFPTILISIVGFYLVLVHRLWSTRNRTEHLDLPDCSPAHPCRAREASSGGTKF